MTNKNSEDQRQIIIGIHSIAEAMLNSKRKGSEIIATTKGIENLLDKFSSSNYKRALENIKVKIVNNDQFLVESQKSFKKFGYEYQRISSQIMMISSSFGIENEAWLYEKMKSGQREMKFLALDRVTDIHNGAAILRTAAFFAVDALILSYKGSFNITPAFFRISSGSVEHVPLVLSTNLSRTVSKLQDHGIECVALSEKNEKREFYEGLSNAIGRCLVLGSEEDGVSHAVMRVVKSVVELKSFGKIKTLNVSVAAAISMDRFFNKKE
ncbi:MAG: RNA methyltransferase [Oligoflexia bacterium]|nr:RNA methyltransferase [Oligoflexia bacterium]MBF0367662.1 RNA methyltransferase [Oligoflexia bacterium]